MSAPDPPPAGEIRPVLLLDNYDSFAYNLVQYLTEAGARVVVRRNDAVAVDQVVGGDYRAVVVSPGPGGPSRAGVAVELVRRAAGILPVLGVCLGHQAVAEAFGGAVVPAPELVHGKATPVHHDGRTLFRGLPDPIRAGRYHSLTVAREGLPSDLEVSAWSASGMIMGLRHRHYAVEGVQFHPESVLTPEGHRMLVNWLRTVP